MIAGARQRIDLALAALVAVVGLVCALWPGQTTILRLVLAGPLLLVAPGYTLSIAFLPRTSIDWATRALLTGGLSLTCLALGGLLLNATPYGLSFVSWAILVGAVTLIAALVGAVRSGGRAVEPGPQRGASLVRGREIAVFAAAGAVLLTTMWVAQTPVPAQPDQGYTLLWALPGGPAQPDTVQVGVRSLEATPTNYHLDIMSGDQTLSDVPVSLNPADEFDADLSLPGAQSGPYVALLYRDDMPGVVYRRVVVATESQS